MRFSTLGIRTLIAVIFGPLIIVSSLLGGWFFFGLITTIVVVSIYEFYLLGLKKGATSQRVIGLIGGLSLLFALFFRGQERVGLVFTLFFVVVLLFELYRDFPAPTLNVAITFLGVCYISFLFGHLLLIRELPKLVNIPYGASGTWIVMMFLSIWACDTAAYFIGSLWGRHKLMERISPNKSVEGAVAGFFTAILVALLCHHWFIVGIGVWDSVVIGAICGSIGQYGDLVESMFKRDANVKDTSAIIPGHGGMMDRFDSPMLVAPVLYLYLRFIVF